MTAGGLDSHPGRGILAAFCCSVQCVLCVTFHVLSLFYYFQCSVLSVLSVTLLLSNHPCCHFSLVDIARVRYPLLTSRLKRLTSFVQVAEVAC